MTSNTQLMGRVSGPLSLEPSVASENGPIIKAAVILPTVSEARKFNIEVFFFLPHQNFRAIIESENFDRNKDQNDQQ